MHTIKAAKRRAIIAHRKFRTMTLDNGTMVHSGPLAGNFAIVMRVPAGN